MNAKLCKTLRSAMRDLHGADWRDRDYISKPTRATRAFQTGRVDTEGRHEVHRVLMCEVRLRPGCGRLLYKRAKRAMGRVQA